MQTWKILIFKGNLHVFIILFIYLFIFLAGLRVKFGCIKRINAALYLIKTDEHVFDAVYISLFLITGFYYTLTSTDNNHNFCA